MYRESARAAQGVVAHDDENSQKFLADKLSAKRAFAEALHAYCKKEDEAFAADNASRAKRGEPFIGRDDWDELRDAKLMASMSAEDIAEAYAPYDEWQAEQEALHRLAVWGGGPEDEPEPISPPTTDHVADAFRAEADRPSPTEPEDASKATEGEAPASEGAARDGAGKIAWHDQSLLDAIPAELKPYSQWVGWRYVLKEGKDKPTKVPFDVRSGIAGWTGVDFETAVRLARVRGMDGVGFIFEVNTPLTAIDLDGARDDGGNLAPHVAEVLSYGESYAEWSPSGNGVHIITSTKIAGQCVNHNAGVEMYGNRRFLTITGRHIDDAPLDINNAPRTVELLMDRVDEFAAKDAAEKAQAGHDGVAQSATSAASDTSSPWRAVNDAAIRNYDKWVPEIFPRHKKLASGVLRVASEDRGRRDLQEDISFSPGGIRDFGLEGGRTAIDIVREFLPAKDAVEAARWLCNKLSLDSKSLGFRWADDKSSKKHHRKPEPQYDPETGEIVDEALSAADDASAQDAPHEDTAPELDEANEKIIADVVRLRFNSFFKAKVLAGLMTDDEAQAGIANYETMVRRALYERVIDCDFPINVQTNNSSREVLVSDIVASPKEFSGKRVRGLFGQDGNLWIKDGKARIYMPDRSFFDLIKRTTKGNSKSCEQEVDIKPTPYSWPEPSSIQPRDWLYGKHYIRGFIGATVAPPGVGKSQMTIAEAASMISGRALLLGIAPVEPLNVWIWNGEDPMEELHRRVAATMKHYGIKREFCQGQLFVDSGRNTKIVTAIQRKGELTIMRPVMDAIMARIKENKIDVLIIDPFVKSHRVSENDNGAIDAIASEWADIAEHARCAIELVHHVRKVGDADVTVEAARGASSLIGAARSARALNQMTEKESREAGVDTHRTYFRVGNGKANMFLPSEKSTWFRMESVDLQNRGPDEEGDSIGVVVNWRWPNPFDDATVKDLNEILRRVDGGVWRANSQAKDWVGNIVADVMGFDIKDPHARNTIKGLLRAWIRNGALCVVSRRDESSRKDFEYVVVGKNTDDEKSENNDDELGDGDDDDSAPF